MQKVYLLKENEAKEKVAKICNIKSDNIKFNSNQKLLGYDYAIIKDGDDDFQIIENYFVPRIYKLKENETIESLQALGYEISPSENISSNDIVILSKVNGKRHIVKPLENLNDIASMYYTDINEIIRRNNLKSNKLFIGQILYI